MTVSRRGDQLVLDGACGVEEAETLALLLHEGAVKVDVRGCTGLHAAALQSLMAFRPELAGESATPFLREVLFPALERYRTETRAGSRVTGEAGIGSEGGDGRTI